MTAAYDLVIREGRVGTAADVFVCDIGVKGGRIAALGNELPKGEIEINARGRLVLPGGIDAHIHLSQTLFDNAELADDFTSGTRSAACGGTTTIIPFAYQEKGQSLRAAVQEYHTRSDGKAYVDYAFHLIITDPTPTVLNQELPALIADGYTSFKLYMTYDPLKLNDRQILEILSLARRERAMSMVHAENTDVISWLTDLLEHSGRTAPKFHAVSRPPVGEGEATHRAISLSELLEVPILIVHVSSREALEEIRRAQSRGLRIHAETCPQYLFLTADDLDLPDGEGVRCICSPPPRDKATQEVLWTGLANGSFDRFIGPFAVQHEVTARQIRERPRRAVLKNPERRARRRNEASAADVRGGDEEPHHLAAIYCADRNQCGQTLRAVESQGVDRDRRRCRPGHLEYRSPGAHQPVDAAPRNRLYAL
jgi:dihydropyrimidinase